MIICLLLYPTGPPPPRPYSLYLQPRTPSHNTPQKTYTHTHFSLFSSHMLSPASFLSLSVIQSVSVSLALSSLLSLSLSRTLFHPLSISICYIPHPSLYFSAIILYYLSIYLCILYRISAFPSLVI